MLDCSTCEYVPKHKINFEDWACPKTQRILGIMNNKLRIINEHEDYICPEYKVHPIDCICGSGPVITIQLGRAWDNGGWWYRTLCCDCGRMAIAGVCATDAINQWNNGKFVINKSDKTLSDIKELLGERGK